MGMGEDSGVRTLIVLDRHMLDSIRSSSQPIA